MDEIAQSIRHNDIESYQKNRYPEILDGINVVFEDEHFEKTDFSQFSAGFFVFKNCILDGARGLYGQPITIEGGSAKGIDLRDVHAIIKARDADFTGALINEGTVLVYDEQTRSEFYGCKMDADTACKLQEMGVIVKS